MPSSLSCSEAAKEQTTPAGKDDVILKKITVNVSLCGSIPRSAISSLHLQRQAPAHGGAGVANKTGLSIKTGHLTVANSKTGSLEISKEQSRLPLRVPNLNSSSVDRSTGSLGMEKFVVPQPSTSTKPEPLTTITLGEKPARGCGTQDENSPASPAPGCQKTLLGELGSASEHDPTSRTRTDQMQTNQQKRQHVSPLHHTVPRAQNPPPAITLQPRLRLNSIPGTELSDKRRISSASVLRRDQVPALPDAAQLKHEPVSALQPAMEPPPWAVAAKGHAKLEPVCDTGRLHQSVDLTTNSHFRVGRSPASDIQLLHSTSSRRHAMLFHHPNGSCYVVDCGSAHGTYVNGVRVRSTFTPTASGHKSVVVPHRVRRGALIRFGGPGAPSFVLKSFSVDIESIVGHVTNMKSRDLEDTPSCSPTLAPSSPKPSLAEPESGNTPQAASQDNFSSSTKTYDSGALVLLNTRLNAIGGAAALGSDARKLARGALAKLSASFYAELKQRRHTGQAYTNEKKRPLHEDEQLSCKRRRSSLSCPSSPLPSPDLPHPSLVSPCPMSQIRQKRPLFPPSAYTLTPAQQSLPLISHVGSQQESGRSTSPILTLSPMRGVSRGTKHRRRVQFSDEPPECAYPHPVTPDELSGDENRIDDTENSDDFSEQGSGTVHLDSGDSNRPLSQNPRTIMLPTPPTTPRVVTLSA